MRLLSKAAIAAAALCLALPLQTRADDTDLSKYNNVFYARPDSALSGGRFQLSVMMNNTDSVTSYQMDIKLPEGFSFVKDGDGAWSATMSTGRGVRQKDAVFNCNYLNGALRIVCTTSAINPSTGGRLAFSGGSGEMFTVPVDVARGVAVGDYPIKISGIVMSDLAATKIPFNLADTIVSHVTVTGEAFDGTVLDELSATAPEASEGAVNVQVRKAVKAGEWTTLCLPFAMTGDELAAAFGDDVMVGDYAGWEDSYASEDDEHPSTLTVNFDRVSVADGLKANHPYIIKTARDIADFIISGVTVAPSSSLTVSTGSARRHNVGSINGNYAAGTAVPATALYLDGGRFAYSDGSATLNAYGAWFEFEDVLQSYYDNGSADSVRLNIDETTGIDAALKNKEERIKKDGSVYGLDGRLVSRNGKAGLGKGVYVVNGKKVVVK